MLNRIFALEQNNTTVRQEVFAGITTFLAMAYIVVVNPAILSDAGMDFGAVFVATCLAAALGSLIMGLYANYPIAQAPGMGQNAFFAYGIVLGMGISWQIALGAVFIAGLIFLVLSVLPIREWLINSIPTSLKLGMSAGIGLFLGVIALTGSKVIIDNPATLISLGDLTELPALLMLLGFMLIAGLTSRGVVGAVLIGIIVITLIAWTLGETTFDGIVSMPPDPSALLELDIKGALEWSMVTVILTLLIVDIFDTAGTLVGVANQANMLDEKGRLPRLKKALLADSSATTAGALLGTSPTTSYIESAAGVQAGGRTGLTAVTTAALFLACLFIAPVAKGIPSFATGAALLFVACLMIRSISSLDWNDITESAPAVIAMLGMPLSYSIADGIGLGFIAYFIIKLLAGKNKDCPPAVIIISAIFILKFTFL
ncbi:NCS2 family permease [Arenicella sp. 4NH20-0111]|uniref:NCS2 family permease n=1 Tax=Arenicella sp. 4NH20-0111 TaxID=3127648 RepID=UPI0031067D90